MELEGQINGPQGVYDRILVKQEEVENYMRQKETEDEILGISDEFS